MSCLAYPTRFESAPLFLTQVMKGTQHIVMDEDPETYKYIYQGIIEGSARFGVLSSLVSYL
jgi:hypothetical protein